MQSEAVNVVIERANRIARGADHYLHGEAYFVCCRALREPLYGPGLVYDHPHNNAQARLMTLAFVLTLLSHSQY